jgi:hypothetical protein
LWTVLGRLARMVRKLTLTSAVMLAAVVAAPAVSAAALPTVSTGGATQISQTTARLNAKVNPQGASTTYSFQYGTTTKYGASTAVAPAGSGKKSLDAIADIGGLQPVTTYHFRVVASNPSGVRSGGDKTFTTSKVPLSLTLGASPNPVPFGVGTTLIGQLAGTGGGGRTIQVQQNAFPYLAGFTNAPVSPVVTGPDGGFSVGYAGLMVNTQVRVVTTSGAKVSSAPILVGVSPKVLTAVSTRHPRRNRYVRFAGTVTPSWVPAQIAIQKRSSTGTWITVAGNVTHSSTGGRATYAKSTRIRTTGTYRVFVGLINSKFSPAVGPSIRITPR